MARPTTIITAGTNLAIQQGVFASNALAKDPNASIVTEIGNLGGKLFQHGAERIDEEEQVRAAIMKKAQSNTDYNRSRDADADLKKAELQFQAWQETPEGQDPDTWTKKKRKLQKDAKPNVTGMSQGAADKLLNDWEISQELSLASTTLAAAKRGGEIAVTNASVEYQTALEIPDLPGEKQKDADGRRAIARTKAVARFENNMTPAEAKALADKMEADGVEARNKQAFSQIKNMAAGNPEQAIKEIDAEMAERKSTGKEASGDDLTNQQLVDTKNYAKSVINTNKIAKENTQKKLENDLSNGVWEGEVSNSDVNEAPLDAAGKRRVRKDIADYESSLKRTVEQGWADEDNRKTYEWLSQSLSDVDSGVTSVADFRSLLGASQEELTETTYKSFQNTARSGGRSAVQKQVESYDSEIYNIVVGPTLSRLDALVASQESLLSQGGQLSPDDQRRLASVRGQKQANTIQYNKLKREISDSIKAAGTETLTSRDVDVIVGKVQQKYSMKTQMQINTEFVAETMKGKTAIERSNKLKELSGIDPNMEFNVN